MNELYNRCHLIAHSLGGVDFNVNLITGTRYLNEAMEKRENEIVKHIKDNDCHVIYRVTPIYRGTNLVASGVHLEAYSVEDKGKLSINEYIYNVQPGININYANGDNYLADETINSKEIISFANVNPKRNPDLMYEIEKQLEILFDGQKETKKYQDMMDKLDGVARKARSSGGMSDWKIYSKAKEYQYDYMNVLSEYVPELLKNEVFFKSVFTR